MLVSTITGRPGTLREFVSMALPPGMLPAGFAMPAAGPASGEPAQHASATVAEGASDSSAAAGSGCEVAASWPPYEGAKLPPLPESSK